MKAYGDIESINLGTGELQRRVAGDGESRLQPLGVPGLKPVNPSYLVEYERAMVDEAIPEIIEAVGYRQRLAAEARQRIL